MERSHQEPQRLVASRCRRVGAEHRNRAAYAVVLERQLQPFSRIHPLIKRNLYCLPEMLGCFGGSATIAGDRLECFGYRFYISNSTKVRPGGWNVAIR